MQTEKRRTFIKKSVVASAGIAFGAPAYIKGYAQVQPSNKINVAVIGVNSRGNNHIRNFGRMPECNVVAICDCVESIMNAGVNSAEELTGVKPKGYIDYREMLEDKDLNVVSIASPGYWHALMTVNACQTGKDVYVEKPCSYNISEGRKMVEAARKYNRMVQVGTQRRANRVVMRAVEMLQDGIIGEIYMGRGTVYRLRASIGTKPDTEVPPGVNWDLFRGPAPMIPFNENHYLYNWHWYWDTSTSEFGNNSIHAMDRIRWAMNINEHPVKISCCGGFYAYDKESDQEVPNLEVATYEYANGAVMESEVRSLINPGNEYDQELLLLGTKGYALLGNREFQVFLTDDSSTRAMAMPSIVSSEGFQPGIGQEAGQLPSQGQQPGQPADSTARQRTAGGGFGRQPAEPDILITEEDLPPDPKWDEVDKLGVNMHYVNFIDCVKSRNYRELMQDIESGHISTAQGHLGNIAYRTGRKLIFDGNTERFVNDPEADTYLARPYGGRKPYNMPDVV